jgi:hypothetical protein
VTTHDINHLNNAGKLIDLAHEVIASVQEDWNEKFKSAKAWYITTFGSWPPKGLIDAKSAGLSHFSFSATLKMCFAWETGEAFILSFGDSMGFSVGYETKVWKGSTPRLYLLLQLDTPDETFAFGPDTNPSITHFDQFDTIGVASDGAEDFLRCLSSISIPSMSFPVCLSKALSMPIRNADDQCLCIVRRLA